MPLPMFHLFVEETESLSQRWKVWGNQSKHQPRHSGVAASQNALTDLAPRDQRSGDLPRATILNLVE